MKIVAVCMQLGGTNAALEVFTATPTADNSFEINSERLYSGKNGETTYVELMDKLPEHLEGADEVHVLFSIAGKVRDDDESTITIANFNIADHGKNSTFNFREEMKNQFEKRGVDPSKFEMYILNDAVAQSTYSAEIIGLKDGEACAHVILGTGFGIIQGNMKKTDETSVGKLVNIVAGEWGHRPMPNASTWEEIEGLKRLMEEDAAFPGPAHAYAPAESFIAGRDGMASTLEHLQEYLFSSPSNLQSVSLLLNKINCNWGTLIPTALTPQQIENSSLFQDGAVYEKTKQVVNQNSQKKPVDWFKSEFGSGWKKEVNVFITQQGKAGDLFAHYLILFTVMRGAEAISNALIAEKLRSKSCPGSGANVESLSLLSLSGSFIISLFETVPQTRALFEAFLEKELSLRNIQIKKYVLNKEIPLDGTSWLAQRILSLRSNPSS